MSMVSEVQQLVDEAGGAVWWTLTQVYDALNASLLDLTIDTKMTTASATLAITSGVDFVAIPTTQILVPQYVVYNSVSIFSTTHDQLEDWSRRWHDQPAAQPKWLVLWDAQTFRTFPAPDANYTFTLYGLKWPDEVDVSTTEVTPLSRDLRRAVVLAAAARLLEFTQPQLADAMLIESEAHKQRSLQTYRRSLGANTLRLRPGVGWQLAQGGDINLGNRYH